MSAKLVSVTQRTSGWSDWLTASDRSHLKEKGTLKHCVEISIEDLRQSIIMQTGFGLMFQKQLHRVY